MPSNHSMERTEILLSLCKTIFDVPAFIFVKASLRKV